MSDAENSIPVPERLSKIESILEKVTGFLDTAAPFLAAIPGAGPVVSVVDGVGHVAEEVFKVAEGNAPEVDSAALAAGQISKSTGNPTLDARIASIEALLFAAIPVVKMVAKQFGHDTPELAVPEVPAISAQG
jgi:hypothetical protein